ncbi:LapA family protein [Oxalobacter sp. OttesenSCG-928-P03]|nr:LapA family protein [Oxalobacter sp. OttesenSCG-928-P03]
MKLVSRIVAILLFILFFGLAVKNTQETTLYFFFGYEMRGPLVLLLLGFFASGSILSILGMTPMIFRGKRELSRKRKLIEALEKESQSHKQGAIRPPPADAPVTDPINNNQNTA